MPGRVLLVEDDHDVAYGIQLALSQEGWTVSHAATGPDGLHQAVSGSPDVVVLDVNLPGMDGLQVCRELRRVSGVPILFLTVRSGELDRVLGLELGADDYLTKPFAIRELCARVRALYRRASGQVYPEAERRLALRDLTIYPEKQRVLRGETEVYLTRTEFQLLLAMARRPGRIFTREDLLEHVWSQDGQFVVDQVVTVHVNKLREKLRVAPDLPELIVTVRGVGYKFVENGL